MWFYVLYMLYVCKVDVEEYYLDVFEKERG